MSIITDKANPEKRRFRWAMLMVALTAVAVGLLLNWTAALFFAAALFCGADALLSESKVFWRTLYTIATVAFIIGFIGAV